MSPLVETPAKICLNQNKWFPTIVNPLTSIWQTLGASGWVGGGGVCDLLKLEPRHEIPMASYSSKPMGLPLAAAASLWVGASGSFWEPPRASERGVV